MRLAWRLLIVLIVLSYLAATKGSADDPTPAHSNVLFQESFEDDRLPERGWYDGRKFEIATERPYAGRGSLAYHWAEKGSTPDNSSGVRRLFAPSESVYLRFHIRIQKDWGWTERAYHPHLMHFMTTENSKFHGPAASHLTVYIEPWNGKLRLAAQDIQNRDMPHGLTQGPLKGGYNGQMFDSQQVLFKDDDWHCVEAFYQLNSIDSTNDRAESNGVVRGWFDGQLVIDRDDVVLRSPDFPRMKFNQYLLTPYFGPGLLPREQTLWIDDLMVAVGRP